MSTKTTIQDHWAVLELVNSEHEKPGRDAFRRLSELPEELKVLNDRAQFFENNVRVTVSDPHKVAAAVKRQVRAEPEFRDYVRRLPAIAQQPARRRVIKSTQVPGRLGGVPAVPDLVDMARRA